MKTENIEDIYELTAIQKGILFESLYKPEFGIYLFQMIITLRGSLNVVAFDRAWQQMAARHTALRTSFYWEDIEKPLQLVHRHIKVPLEEHDWRGVDPVEQQKRFKSFLQSDRQRGFDFSQECLMRLNLIRFNDQFYQFVWSHHFIIIDGWSIPLVLKEFTQLYEAFCQGQDVPLLPGIPYRNYIDWLQQQDSSKAEKFWRQALSGVQAPTPLTNLVIDHLSSQEERYDEQQIYLSVATTAALQSLARQHQLTLSTLFLGAWAMLLSRYSCKNEVVFGCTVSGRPVDLVGAESLVGMLLNTLPIQVKVDGEQSVLVWLKQLQAQLVEMRQYEYSPLVDIQGWSKVPRGVPLFESFVVFENVPVDPLLRQWKGNLEVLNVTSFYKTNYPLNVVVYPSSPFMIGISYDFHRFDTATIICILNDFKLLFQSMVANPEVGLKELSLLTERERHMTLMLEKEVTFDFDFASSN